MVRIADWVLQFERSHGWPSCPSQAGREGERWWTASCPYQPCCASSGISAAETPLTTAGPDTTFTGLPEESGIVYAVNGVCHQIANRILYPHGRIVSRATGYWLSVSVFGTYGTNVPPTGWLASSGIASAVGESASIDWHSRLTHGHHHPDDAAYGIAEHRESEIAYLREVRSLYAEADPTVLLKRHGNTLELHTRELEIMFEYRLGSAVGRGKLRRLRELHRAYLSQRPEALAPDSSGRLDAAALAASINHHVQQFSADVARVLGADLCERLYAFPPDRKIDLVNPAILAAFDDLLTA